MLDLIRSIMPFGESAWPRFLREHNTEEEEKAG